MLLLCATVKTLSLTNLSVCSFPKGVESLFQINALQAYFKVSLTFGESLDALFTSSKYFGSCPFTSMFPSYTMNSLRVTTLCLTFLPNRI